MWLHTSKTKEKLKKFFHADRKTTRKTEIGLRAYWRLKGVHWVSISVKANVRIQMGSGPIQKHLPSINVDARCEHDFKYGQIKPLHFARRLKKLKWVLAFHVGVILLKWTCADTLLQNGVLSVIQV